MSKRKILYIPKERITRNLWEEYTKSSDYQEENKIHGIDSEHPIIISRESRGLEQAINKYIREPLSKTPNFEDYLNDRTASEWVQEWKGMHDCLFRDVLVGEHRGVYRKIDVMFGSPGDEEPDKHNIPKSQFVAFETEKLASRLVNQYDLASVESPKRVFQVLAQIHYEFIRVHPFHDGNGRIARLVTDQLSVYFGYPPAMESYPRHDKEKRLRYHEAIVACMDDPQCDLLASWIRNYIETQLDKIA